MADGGFRVEFDGKVVKQCYKVSFDYDEWTYVANFDAPQPLPDTLKSISVKLEDTSR